MSKSQMDKATAENLPVESDDEQMVDELRDRKTIEVWAPPSRWGRWADFVEHYGPLKLKIRAHSKTMAEGQVRYMNTAGKNTTDNFHKSIIIQTGNVTEVIVVRFKGVPLGTTVTCMA